MTSATELCSSQQLSVLVSQASNAREVSRQNPHLHFRCIYFNILSDWKLLITFVKWSWLSLALLWVEIRQNWCSVLVVMDRRWQEVQFSWGLKHEDDTGKRERLLQYWPSRVREKTKGKQRNNFYASLLADLFAISLSQSMGIMSVLARGFIFYCLSSMWSEESGK